MRTAFSLLLLALILSACDTMRETTSVKDDVYDIPDRRALATAAAARDEEQQIAQEDDYYDPKVAHDDSARDYYDMTYNDPYYYNYGRFGLGSTTSDQGPVYGMGMSYGWPTGFGSMSLGIGTGYGYTPYGGYGYNPYDQYGYYGYGNYGYGFGGYGTGYGGYNPYQGPWAGSYIPPGFGYGNAGDIHSSGVVYGHRPSISSGSANFGGSPSPLRMYRGPAGLLQADGQPRQPPQGVRSPQRRNIAAPANTGSTGQSRQSAGRPAPNWGFGTEGGPSRSGGGEGNGGHISAPRPR